jgi:hypothetical protein
MDANLKKTVENIRGRFWCVSVFISSVLTSCDGEYFISHMGCSLEAIHTSSLADQSTQQDSRAVKTLATNSAKSTNVMS